MSQFEKLIAKIKSLDNNMRFSELRRVLESYGYVMRSPSKGSSHMTFRKAGRRPITIPTHEPIKKVYVLLVKELIESEEQEDEKAE